MTRLTALLCSLLLLTAGVGSAAVAAEPSTATSGTLSTSQPQLDQSAPVGCVDGICYDDDLPFDEATDLTDDELDILVDRTMARVEQLRGQKFDSEVPVEVQSRAEFREDNLVTNTSTDETFERWNDGVWKGLFIIGDDQRSAAAIDGTIGEAVSGFYVPSENRIVIVSSTPDSPTVNEQTLLHELGHAMQDQYHDLSEPTYRGVTQDRDLAVDGAVEGEAAYLGSLYSERCSSGQWDCFDTTQASGGSSGGSGESTSNPGVLFLLLQPYSDGPAYIHEIRETDGWEGVSEHIESPPTTTTEIIHQQPMNAPSLDVPDESTDGWERYPEQGGGAEVTGEASIYVMFWYQAREYGADTIDPQSFTNTDQPYDRYDYVSEPSEGWAGDELYPYKRGDDDGYVWSLEWDSTADATEFAEAYGEILTAHDAAETDSGAYVVSNGSFSGTYGVEVDGTRVTIVHAPTEAGLFELRPSLEPTPVVDDGSRLFQDDVPGFGVAAAVAALLAVVIAGRLD
ncbi:PGF-CTERM protein [Halohasta litchfieldiae]|jgi:PGF-CTERM protein|uniref:PGF-CTERM protein n=1 Tax=Halohasta litchfieldiae TaxID=1073996 RepID=A0A1H6UAQ5_9EURY|nr:Hvo_1808 family surface protein [Halohasta litchfieldiae]ATW87120.1 PGF-CTERM protein [Halohasta litchfieldiae]SEI85310.1 PGF-CTERM protein [Halohasta litchfieldiae]